MHDTQANTLDQEERIDILGEEQTKDEYDLMNSDNIDAVKAIGGNRQSTGESMYYLSIHKAGLELVDKDKIHKIIQEASK